MNPRLSGAGLGSVRLSQHGNLLQLEGPRRDVRCGRAGATWLPSPPENRQGGAVTSSYFPVGAGGRVLR
jgi:hypothetical protein